MNQGYNNPLNQSEIEYLEMDVHNTQEIVNLTNDEILHVGNLNITPEGNQVLSTGNDSPKYLIVELRQAGIQCPNLKNDNIENIELDHEIAQEEFDVAVDTILTFFKQKEIFKIEVDIQARNIGNSDVLEVTMDEIEATYGRKIKIINNKEGK